MRGERVKHLRGRREPGVEHIGADDAGHRVQPVKTRADGLKERASMKAGRRLSHGDAERPARVALQRIQRHRSRLESAAQARHRLVQEVIAHRAGLHGQSAAGEACFEVNGEHLLPPDRREVRAAVRLDPAEGGIHEQRGELCAAVRPPHGEQAHLEETVIHAEGQLLAPEILVEGVADSRRRRRQADEARDLAAAAGHEVQVHLIERVGEAALRIHVVLADLARIDLVAQAVDRLALRIGGEAELVVRGAFHRGTGGCRGRKRGGGLHGPIVLGRRRSVETKNSMAALTQRIGRMKEGSISSPRLHGGPPHSNIFRSAPRPDEPQQFSICPLDLRIPPGCGVGH